MAEIIDLTNDELEKLGYIQYKINKKYMGKPKDLKILAELCREMEERCRDIGIIVEMEPHTDNLGNWSPICNVVGRVEEVEFDPEKVLAERSVRKSGLIV